MEANENQAEPVKTEAPPAYAVQSAPVLVQPIGPTPILVTQYAPPQPPESGPSFGCVLAETIIGFLFCCWLLGLIGLIMALTSDGGRNKDTLRCAHYFGLSSIFVGVGLQVVGVCIGVIVLIIYLYALHKTNTVHQ